jgi:tetratricopeptide (TPR) repeat protein
MEMPKNKLFFSILLLFLPVAIFGQISEEEILSLLERHELAIARERINQAYRQNPNSASAAYLHAMIEDEGETANKYFQEVAARFRGTVYAERALFRLGQYHFAEGTYNRARQYFTSLIEQYPQSSLASQSSYYAAKSLAIIGAPAGTALPQAQEELARCVEKYPGTWIAKFAAEDLAKLQQPNAERKEKKTESPPAPKKPQGLYTVEIGSFNSREKAVSQQAIFSKAGYPTEIKEERKGRKMVYKVLAGDFADRDQARKFAEEMQRKFKAKCHVLKRAS